MKKFLSISLIIISIFILVACNANFKFKENLTLYNLNISYDEQMNKLECETNVDYVNKSDNTLDVLKFHLYPNAFRENAKASVVSLANVAKAYPNGKSYGNIEIKSVTISEKKVEYAVNGEDENILEVPLFNNLYPNDRVQIKMNFTVNLANINHRLGYGENAINVCNFYPIACVYEDGEFVCDLYNSNGDPFYSDVADYTVTITMPKDYVLASSGKQVESFENEQNMTYKIKANCVRDFGFVMSKKFKIKTQNYANRVDINYYYLNDDIAEETMSLIENSLAFFEKKIGLYPYDSISVVQTNFVHGGMEYPNMVLVSDDVKDYETYRIVIVHELCHQWWYGVVGNNQFDYGWIDEGLTEFCTTYFFENHSQYGRSMENMIRAATFSYTTFMKVYFDVQGEVDTSMNRALNEFNTEPEYVYNTYVKGMLMFSTVYELVGYKKFDKALQYYYETNLYENVNPVDVIKCFSKATGKNLENLFNSYLKGKVKIIAK